MVRYTPSFILHNYEKHVLKGAIQAYVLLLDVADFTKIGTALQKEGKPGAEELSKFLDLVFRTPLEIVHKHGGFVSLFAGDSFCAVFPEPEVIVADPGVLSCVSVGTACCSALNSIQEYFVDRTSHKTPFGDFTLKVRQTICYGKVFWQIFPNSLQNEYVFYGDTMQEMSELSALKEDVIFSESATMTMGEQHFLKLDKGYRLINKGISAAKNTNDVAYCDGIWKSNYQYAPETLSKFLNPKFSSETPQNEIRSGAYCFANLEGVKPENREKTIENIQYLADKYGGFVNKYDATDKGLIAIILFGLPRSEDKTLDRICRFALKAVEEHPELALGIASGSVFAGYSGSGEIREYTALGHPMNLAARLMSKASAGEILADNYLYLELSKAYEFDLIGSISLKGISFPIKHYLLNHKTYTKTAYQESRFVGRDSEIIQIQQVILKSLANSQNSIVYVLGDAGIGKSRLIKEAISIYPEAGFNKFFCYCDAILPKPGELIKQIIRSYFGYSYEKSVDDGLKAFREKWAALAQKDPELIRIESIIASLLGFEWQGSIWSVLPPDEKPSQLQNAFLSLLKTITAINPVLIHLDDAQWIDSQSKEYLQMLSDEDVAPVLILAACRYLDNGDKPDLELIHHQSVLLDLNTLCEEGSHQLIQSMVSTSHLEDKADPISLKIPEHTFVQINSRAMGNPFYIEQLVSYFVENGKLDAKGEITGDVAEIGSFSISDIIGSRIDRLTANLRELVSNASVLGMEFNVAVLSKMLNNYLNSDLELGTSSRIWKDLDELRYIFSHILIRDVVYQRMLSDKLQKLHQTAAKAMEIVYNDKLDEQAEEIAYHFDKGNLLLKATDFYVMAGCFFREKYDFERAVCNFKRAIEILKSELGEENAKTISALDELGGLYFNFGEFTDAEILYQNALLIRERTLGEEHIDTALSLSNLATMYDQIGKYAQSEPMYLKALSIYEKSLDPDHPLTITALENLATMYLEQGKHNQAEPLFLRVLDSNEKITGSESSETANTLNGLALLYQSQEKYDEAESMSLRALKIRESVLGPEHPDTASSLHNLSALYYSLGNYTQAEPLEVRALGIKERVLGSKHPNTGNSLNNMGLIYSGQKKYEESESCYLRAKDIYLTSLGENHPNTASAITNLARLYTETGKTDQAVSHYLKALKTFESVYGDNHPKIAIVLHNLARIYKSKCDLVQSESLYLRSLSIRESVWGPMHPSTIGMVKELISLYEAAGNLDKVTEYQARLDNNAD